MSFLDYAGLSHFKEKLELELAKKVSKEAQAEKTAAMTEPVGIDVNGKLWVNVTGGGGGTMDFEELDNRPKYSGNRMTGSTDIPEVPDSLSDLSDDSTHRLVTDSEKLVWNGKQDAISDLSTIRSNASAGKTASDNLGGHTVAKDVPSNAVFTDTTSAEDIIYSSSGSHTAGSVAAAIAEQSSQIDQKEASSNKVTSLSSSSTDMEYPSAKCVYDIIGDVESALAALR